MKVAQTPSGIDSNEKSKTQHSKAVKVSVMKTIL